MIKSIVKRTFDIIAIILETILAICSVLVTIAFAFILPVWAFLNQVWFLFALPLTMWIIVGIIFLYMWSHDNNDTEEI